LVRREIKNWHETQNITPGRMAFPNPDQPIQDIGEKGWIRIVE